MFLDLVEICLVHGGDGGAYSMVSRVEARGGLFGRPLPFPRPPLPLPLPLLLTGPACEYLPSVPRLEKISSKCDVLFHLCTMN